MNLDRLDIIKKLLETGMIDRSTLSQVMTICKDKNEITLKVLANYAGLSTIQIREFFETHFNIPNVDLDNIVLNPAIVKLVPPEIAMAHLIVPAFQISQKTHIAVSNPLNIEGLEEISKFTGNQCSIFMTSEDQVKRAIDESRFIEGSI